MGWFSELMFGKEKPLGNINKAVEYSRQQAVDSFKVPDVTKDISEPVLAIVEAMKTRSSTFKLINTEQRSGFHSSLTTYTLKDIKTDQLLTVKCDTSFYGEFNTHYTYSWSWLTEDEGEILRTEFIEINRKKMKRKFSIERARMKGIYK